MSRGGESGKERITPGVLPATSADVIDTAWREYNREGVRFSYELFRKLEQDQGPLGLYIRKYLDEVYATYPSIRPEKYSRDEILGAAGIVFDLLRRQFEVNQMEGEKMPSPMVTSFFPETITDKELQSLTLPETGYKLSENYVERCLVADENEHLVSVVQDLLKLQKFFLGDRVRHIVLRMYGVLRIQFEKKKSEQQ